MKRYFEVPVLETSKMLKVAQERKNRNVNIGKLVTELCYIIDNEKEFDVFEKDEFEFMLHDVCTN